MLLLLLVDDDLLTLPRELMISTCLLREGSVNGEKSFDGLFVSREGV